MPLAPPPPPPPRRSPPGPRQADLSIPDVGERFSQASKDAIAESALGLLEEQVQARIVHYKADLVTNPELDAITAQVVEQLKQMQASFAAKSDKSPDGKDSIAAQQEKTLAALLARVFPREHPSLPIEKRMKSILRKLARVFFESELHERTRGQDGVAKTIQHGEQAIFYLLSRYGHRMTTELENFEFATPEVKERSFELLRKLTKDMQDGFLARRSSELKRLVSVFNAVLVDFVGKQLSPVIPTLSHEVVHQAATFEGRSFGYKITADAFPRFRAAFERRFMVRLVGYAEDELVKQLADTAGSARNDTIKFLSNPELWSMICLEISSAVYEFLFSEGFLDLPQDWLTTEVAAS
jgi:hypothetical protein